MATVSDDQAIGVTPTRLGGTTNRSSPNVLDKYASYAYNLSLYMLSTGDLESLTAGSFNPGDSKLLMRSGGSGAGRRNQYFQDVDFVIDNVSIEQLVGSKATGAPYATAEVKFTITEPLGVSLLDRLGAAANSLYSGAGYLNAIYLLSIKFYGYDDQGNAVDSSEIPTKQIPLLFTALNFKVGVRNTEYTVEAISPHDLAGLGRINNRVPTNIELGAGSLKEIFGDGNGGGSNAGTASGKGAATSLIDAINKFYQDQVKKGVISQPIKYKVVLDGGTLPNAKLTDKSIDLVIPTSSGDTAAADPSSGATANRDKRRVSSFGGQTITQVIEKIIRLSTYIEDQQKEKVVSTDNARTVQEKRPSGGSPLKWIRIIPHVKPTTFDTKRQDWGWEITYYVREFSVYETVIPGFEREPWPGPDKFFSFSFTGQNTSVLKYEQEFNYLYYQNVSELQSPPENTGGQQEKFKHAAGPNASSYKQGKKNNEADSAASAAGSLYSPADLAFNNMTIVGDPELLFSESSSPSEILSRSRTLPSSYSLNKYNGDVTYVIYFRKPADYDDNGESGRGVMEFGSSASGAGGYSSTFSAAYKMIKSVSKFVRGQFTQEIEGVLMTDVDPSGANKGNPRDSTVDNNGVISRSVSGGVESDGREQSGAANIREQSGAALQSTPGSLLASNQSGRFSSTPRINETVFNNNNINTNTGGSLPTLVQQTDAQPVTSATAARLASVGLGSDASTAVTYTVDKLKPNYQQSGAVNR